MLNTEIDIKKELSNVLNKKRMIRSLDTFWVFKHVWEIHQRCDERKNIFVSTKKLLDMGINTPVYKPYFDLFIGEWEDETYNWSNSNLRRCKYISTWSPYFEELMEKTKSFDVPQEIVKSYSHKISPLENPTKLSGAWDKLFPNKPMQDFMTSTCNSPCRLYHPIQNVKKDARDWAFKGMYEIDLSSAFGSIAFNVLGMKDSHLEGAWMLNPQCKDIFLEKLCDTFRCDKAKAKEQRSALFVDKNPWGILWYDNLNKDITRRAQKHYGTYVLRGKRVQIDTLHKFFTYHEALLIDSIKVRLDVDAVLTIHDGLISTSKPAINTLQTSNGDYLLSVRKLGE